MALMVSAHFGDRAVGEDTLDAFPDVMEACGMERDVAELAYYPTGEDETLDRGMTES